MSRIRVGLTVLFFFYGLGLIAQIYPKREFRGAWIHVIGQDQYQNMNPEEMARYFIQTLDVLEADGINAVIFQVRPTADAFYYSELEPSSKYFTGEQGKSPQGNFDPMQFMITECHKRNMEFHAWLNPYRVTATNNTYLHSSHIYYRHPEWFVRYGSQLYFDPGIPQCRKFICQVVKDIVSRYEIDAIHMDDYFYPYPVSGEVFPDDDSFRQYGLSQGFSYGQKADWRRNNVNTLIEEIRYAIVGTKPWVRFGISPFGIYRNKKDTPDGSGSDTRGLQNYQDLYSDVKLWLQKGWIDYCIPQIYWEIGHSAADYETLIRWWNENGFGIHLYIGQDVRRTVNAKDTRHPERNQLTRKMELERTLPNIDGNCFWPAYELLKNAGGISDSLRSNYHRYPALIPAYTYLHHKRPKDVKSLKAEWTEKGYLLHWKKNGDIQNPENAQYYVIYRFANKEKTDLNDPSKIMKITRDTEYLLPYQTGNDKYKYVVTSVDKFHNESKKGKSKKVKL